MSALLALLVVHGLASPAQVRDSIGDGGPALEADFHLPGTMALDPEGALLVVEKWNGRLRRIDLAADRVETFAGARLNEPTPEVSYHFHHDGPDVPGRRPGRGPGGGSGPPAPPPSWPGS